MTNTEILNSWREPIKKAVKETFNRFVAEPKTILTESDLKCNLYMDLINQNPYVRYAVHTEVTHYIGERVEDDRRKYHYRDMSLLCPWLIRENEEIWAANEPALSKGFKHNGPAIHFELKIARQPIRQNGGLIISNEDILNLNNLIITAGHEKRYVIVWISKNTEYNVEHMYNQLRDDLTNLDENIKNITEIYLLDRTECKRIEFLNGRWTDNNIN